MTQSRLIQLYDAAQNRSKRKQLDQGPGETEEQRNRRILLDALKQQQAEDSRHTGKHTRYVGNGAGYGN